MRACLIIISPEANFVANNVKSCLMNKGDGTQFFFTDSIELVQSERMMRRGSKVCVSTSDQTCYCYNSISLASSSEKSDMELSEEEERSS